MIQGGQKYLEVFLCAPGAAGKIDNEAGFSYAHHGPGDHGMGRFLQTRRSHGLCHAGDLVVDYFFHCLGSDITGAQTRSTGGNNKRQLFVVSPRYEGLCDLTAIIRDDLPHKDGLTPVFKHFCGNIATLILPFSFITLIADGQNTGPDLSVH